MARPARSARLSHARCARRSTPRTWPWPQRLVMGTFGNVSGVSRAAGLMAIKPSGVPYERLAPRDIVLVALEDGAVVDSKLRPSSDTPTHLELYRAFPACGGIVHTHSQNATSLARPACRCAASARRTPTLPRRRPATRSLDENEVAGEYERNTGLVIVETFRNRGISPEQVEAVLVVNHGPFTWDARRTTRSRTRRSRVPGRDGDPDPGLGPRGEAAGGVPGRQALPAQARQRRVLRAGPDGERRANGPDLPGKRRK